MFIYFTLSNCPCTQRSLLHFFRFAAVLLGARRVSTTAATFSSSFVLEMCSNTGISADIHHDNKLTKASYMCPHYQINAQYLCS